MHKGDGEGGDGGGVAGVREYRETRFRTSRNDGHTKLAVNVLLTVWTPAFAGVTARDGPFGERALQCFISRGGAGMNKRIPFKWKDFASFTSEAKACRE